MIRPLKKTLSLPPAATKTPEAEDAAGEIPAKPCPWTLSAFVTLIDPYPAGSSTSISPPGETTLAARLKVRHGFAKLQSFASAPCAATKTRRVCAWAAPSVATIRSAEEISDRQSFDMKTPSVGRMARLRSAIMARHYVVTCESIASDAVPAPLF